MHNLQDSNYNRNCTYASRIRSWSNHINSFPEDLTMHDLQESCVCLQDLCCIGILGIQRGRQRQDERDWQLIPQLPTLVAVT